MRKILTLAFGALLALFIVSAASGAAPAPTVSVDSVTQNSVTLGLPNGCGQQYRFQVSKWVNGRWSNETTRTATLSPCTPPPPPVTYTVAVAKSGSGSGTVTSSPAGVNCGATCTGTYNSGTTVTLTATAASGSTFVGYSGDCTGTTCTLNVNANKNVTATFDTTPPPPPPTTFTVTVAKAGSGAGTVTSSPAGISCGTTCVGTFNSGTVVSLTSVANSGSSFVGYSGDCTGTTCTLTVNANKNVTATFNTTPPPPPGGQRFDVMEPSGTAGLPRSLTYCLANIVRDPYDPNGNSPYNVPRDDLSTGWSLSQFSWWNSFPKWIALRNQIDDHYTYADGSQPTTTEIFSIAACRWGLREDLLRAVAVQESDWHEHTGSFSAWGDRCSGHTNPDDGYGSYGIMQMKNFNCAGEGDWGGFPRSWYSTPFNVDHYGAMFRGCLEQVFWAGHNAPAGDSDATKERGCVGAWFSGGYSPTSSYTNSVYTHLANRDWTSY